MFNRKGQNIAEYSILIALVIAAAVAMQVYVKRGLQGKVADAVDHAPNLAIRQDDLSVDVNFKTPQYEPYYLRSTGEVESSRNASENMTANALVNRVSNEATTRLTGAIDETTYNGQNLR